MSRIITQEEERHPSLAEADEIAFADWEEELLLPMPREEPPIPGSSTSRVGTPLERALERTVAVETQELMIELSAGVARIVVPPLLTADDREQLLHDLMILRDSYPAYRRWAVDFSRLGKIPLMILGALREYHFELREKGGGVTLLLGAAHSAEPHTAAMIRRMFEIAD